MGDEKSPAVGVKNSSLADMLAIEPDALKLYFDMTAYDGSLDRESLLTEFKLSTKKLDKCISQLQNRGLVRQNQDNTFEAIAPIEAVMIVLTNIRGSLRQLREQFPQELTQGLPSMSPEFQQQLDRLPSIIFDIRSTIDKALNSVLIKFQAKAEDLHAAPNFEVFTNDLHQTLIEEVNQRINEVRSQLDDFGTLETFSAVLEKLKNDVFDIVNISLSDMKEKAFRLHELEQFKETLADFWNTTPSVISSHLTTFEQEMSTLEASLGDLFETKYRLGAFKGVIENFAREHIMTAVRTLKKNFQISLTESIQDHLQYVQERYSKVSVAALQNFEQLREKLANWVKMALDMAFNEVAHRNKEAAADLASELKDITYDFQRKFAEGLEETISAVNSKARELDVQLEQVATQVPRLHEQEIRPKLDKILAKAEKRLEKFARGVPKTLEEWRLEYLQTAQKQVRTLLDQAQAQATFAAHGLNQVWQRSRETTPEAFDLYHFVIGQDEFESQLVSHIGKARHNLLIILPRGITIKQAFIQMIPSDVRVRLVISDSPESPSTKKLLKEFGKLDNLQIRQDPRSEMWGILSDFKEILLGNTAKGTANVVGIASSHEDHVELLRPLLETRWLHARSL